MAFKDPKTVALLGGTGFIGSYIMKSLLANNWHVKLMVHRKQPKSIPGNIRIIQGTVQDSQQLDMLLKDTVLCIYNIGIIRENRRQGITFCRLHTEGLEQTVEAAERNGIRHLVYVSANGVEADSVPYQRTKLAAENTLRNSGLNWMILRPSLVFGPPGIHDEFCSQMVRQLVMPPLPVPDFFNLPHAEKNNPIRFTPIHAEDLSEFLVRAVDTPQSWNRIFQLGGEPILSWRELISEIASAVHRDKWMLPVPIQAVIFFTKLLEWLPGFPVASDQLRMLSQGNLCPTGEFEKLMGRLPIPLNSKNLSYLNKSAI